MDNTNVPVCYYNQTAMFFYNLSGRDLIVEEQHYRSVGFFIGVLLTGVSIIFLNGLVLTAIVINRRLHYPFYYLLGNLAVTDLCVGISYLVITCLSGVWTSTVSTSQWFFRQGLIDTSLMASLMNLMAIALERQQTIFTMQLHSKMTNQRIILLIVAVWIMAILIGLSPVMGWNCLCDLSSCSETLPLFSRSYVLTISILSLLIMFIVVILYTCICVYVWKKSRRMTEHTSRDQSKGTVVSLMNTVLLILGCFVLCWTPALLLLLLDGLHHVPQKLLVVESFILTLVACNSLVNPIIYTYRDQDVRTTFKCIFCCFCQQQHLSNHLGYHCNTSQHFSDHLGYHSNGLAATWDTIAMAK
uniref:G-protein coupled receptors family 1 profile domain-containing protein n=1 Tax=Pygocentrus nattereri TaxID=42514 RepID=A0A3B4DML6_PYGNA